MLRAPEPVLILIADITGYTTYLSGTEIDHAQNVIQDLLETVMARMSPPFQLVKVEGDACFTFAPGGTVSGQLLLDTIDSTYFGFRRRLRDVKQATSCECNACMLIPRLDLKFFAHAGQAVRQRAFGAEDLVGPDVILVHRLMKNHVTEELGMRAYALLTEAGATATGLDCRALTMTAHREDYDVGPVVSFVEDLELRWQADDSQVQRRLRPEEVISRLEFELPAPPAVVWDWLNDPRLRVRWQIGTTGVTQDQIRLEAGTTNHCAHGEGASIEEILEWKPFESSTRTSKAFFGQATFTYDLDPTPAGTRFVVLTGRTSATPGLSVDQLLPMLEQSWGGSIARLSELISAEARAGGPAVDSELTQASLQ